MDRLSEGYKQAIDQIRGPIAKTDFWAKIRVFGLKKHPLHNSNPVLVTTVKSCANEKVPFSQINISILANFGCFLGEKMDFWPKTRSKIKATYNNDWALDQNGNKNGVAPENDPYLGNGIFFLGGPNGKS